MHACVSPNPRAPNATTVSSFPPCRAACVSSDPFSPTPGYRGRSTRGLRCYREAPAPFTKWGIWSDPETYRSSAMSPSLGPYRFIFFPHPPQHSTHIKSIRPVQSSPATTSLNCLCACGFRALGWRFPSDTIGRQFSPPNYVHLHPCDQLAITPSL